jgi:hypothetical protein
MRLIAGRVWRWSSGVDGVLDKDRDHHSVNQMLCASLAQSGAEPQKGQEDSAQGCNTGKRVPSNDAPCKSARADWLAPDVHRY